MDLFHRLTDRVRKVFLIARRMAQGCGAACTEPEHVLMALAEEGTGVAAFVLRKLGTDAAALRPHLPLLFPTVDESSIPPLGDAVHQLLRVSHAEKLLLGHDYVGTEHLLLALAQVSMGPVPKALAARKLDREKLRDELCRVLNISGAQVTRNAVDGKR